MKNLIYSKTQLISISIVVFIAVLLRLNHLGSVSLAEKEADLALQALTGAVHWGGEPLYLTLTSALFSLFSGTNFLARLIPALCGISFVVLPLFFHKQLGSWTVICFSAFLALDPSLISGSRMANGAMISLFLLGLAVIFIQKNKPIQTGIILGLVFVSGLYLWMILLPFLLAVLAERTIYREDNKFLQLPQFDFKDRTFWYALGGTALLAGTLFIRYPQAISSLLSSVTDYLHLWAGNNGISQKMFWLGLLLYFPFGMVFGIWGGIRSLLSKDRLGRFIFIWLIIGMLVVIVLPGKQLQYLLGLVIPMYLLASSEIIRHLEVDRSQKVQSLGVALLVFTIITFLYLSIARIVYTGDQKQLFLALIGGAAILIISAFLIALGWSQNIAVKGYLWGFVVILCLYQLSTASRVAGTNGPEQSELIGAQESYPQLQLLNQTINDLHNLSTSIKGDQLTVVGIQSQALKWNLRNFTDVNYDLSLDSGTKYGMVLAQPENNVMLADQYRGQVFMYKQSIRWDEYSLMDWISWLVHRKTLPVNDTIVLWVRADLFSDAQPEPFTQP